MNSKPAIAPGRVRPNPTNTSNNRIRIGIRISVQRSRPFRTPANTIPTVRIMKMPWQIPCTRADPTMSLKMAATSAGEWPG